MRSNRIDSQTESKQRAARQTIEHSRLGELFELKTDILSQMSYAVIAVDSEQNITYWNKGAEQLYDLKRDEVLGRPLREAYQCRWLKPDDEQAAYESLAATGFWHGENIHIDKSGKEIYVESSISVLRDESNDPAGLLAVVHDITGQKRLLEQIQSERLHAETLASALKKERDTLQVIMENTGAHLAYLDSHFKFIRVNSTYARGTGHKRDELIGRDYFELFPNPENQAIFEKVRDTGETAEFKAKPFEFADQPWRGTTYWDWMLTPIKDVSGHVDRLVLSLIDVTERKRTEEALREAHDELEMRVQERTAELEKANQALKAEIIERERAEQALEAMLNTWQNTFDAISDGVWILDAEGRIIQSNGVFERLLGVNTGNASGMHCYEIAHCTSGFIEKCPFERMKRAGTREYIELEDKERGFWFQITVDPIRDRSGSIISAVHIVSDITERKQAEKALRESEACYRSLVENAMDVIFTLSSDGTLTSLNPAFEKVTGWSRSEWLGRHFAPLVHPDDLPLAIEVHQRLFNKETVKNFELRILSKSGDYVNTEFAVAPQLHDGKVVSGLGITRDITGRRRAEEHMREQAALLDKAQDTIAVRDLDHRLIYWNKGAERMYGWTAEEVAGKNANELLYEEESSRLIEAKKSMYEKGEWMGELQQVTKDGKKIIVESRWTLVRDGEGKPKSILIINTDITEKKKLEAQFLRAQRIEGIGMLAGGIAHDLNNVMTPIMMAVQILKEKFKDEESQMLLSILETSSRRGADLIKQVLSFARGIEGERIALKVTHLINEIRKIVKETFPKSIESRIDISKELYTISGDATQLHQVLMNLCVNARDAMPYGGILNITAKNFFIDENYTRMNIDARVGPYIVISVSDTGTGIPPEIQDRIFEPFFTTKEHGEGTGLGLSTVLAIVKGHGGFINVYSELGKGTTFKVYLPAIKTEIEKTEEPEPEMPAGHGELILVVDDEAPIREITTSTLEKNGYRAITANDGAEAIASYVQNKEEINVVLMDMMMPIMDGKASIRALRKINPKVKIIALSGFTENGRFVKFEGNVDAFLTKPYTAEKLLKTIQEVMMK